MSINRHSEPAIERARQRWREAGVQGRSAVQDRGVPASTWLDAIASQSRGVKTPDGIDRLALELLEAGVPSERVQRIVVGAVAEIVAARVQTMGRPPRAA